MTTYILYPSPPPMPVYMPSIGLDQLIGAGLLPGIAVAGSVCAVAYLGHNLGEDISKIALIAAVAIGLFALSLATSGLALTGIKVAELAWQTLGSGVFLGILVTVLQMFREGIVDHQRHQADFNRHFENQRLAHEQMRERVGLNPDFQM